MIRSRSNQSENSLDGITLSDGIVLLSGNPRQIFSPLPAPGSYDHDRRLVPCVLGGHVSVIDPTGVMGGEVPLSDIEWYTQPPVENDYSNIIQNPSPVPEDAASYRQIDYLISDGSGAAWCSGVPRGCLIIHKNIPAGTGQVIYGVLKFIDVRTGHEVRRTRSYSLGTSGFDNESVVLKGPDTAEVMIDALAVPDTVPSGKTVLSIPWSRTVGVQLTGAEGDVQDSGACYLWTIGDGNGYREFTEDEIDVLGLQGLQTKSLSFDARMIVGTMALRCYACRREGNAWSDPRNGDNPVYDCRVTQKMNNNITADPVQKKGAVQNFSMSRRCLYDMDIRYCGNPVPSVKKCLFRVHWFTTGLVTRNGQKVHVKNDMGWGPDLSFVPSDNGYTYADGYQVHAEIPTFAGCVPVEWDGNLLTQGGELVIAPTYQ